MKPYYQDDYVTIYNADCREALKLIPDNSVDLVLTDPPYPKEYINLWSELSVLSAAVLKPGNFMVALSGQNHIVDVLNRLSEHLEYYWLGMLYHKGIIGHRFDVNLRNRAKPVLFFVKPPRTNKNHTVFEDVIVSSGRVKKLHPWQQSESEADQIISNFTKPGDLILDPFMGSGTNGMSAKKLGRRFIGFEISERYSRVSMERCSQSVIGFVTDNSHRCYICGGYINGKRSGSQYCSNRCRQAAYRQRLLQIGVTDKEAVLV